MLLAIKIIGTQGMLTVFEVSKVFSRLNAGSVDARPCSLGFYLKRACIRFLECFKQGYVFIIFTSPNIKTRTASKQKYTFSQLSEK